MGFDLYALDPITDSEEHGYFRANVWRWRPLWAFVEYICEDILDDSEKKAGYYNDGDTISKEKAEIIGNKLKISLADETFNKFKTDCDNSTTNTNTGYQCDYELTKQFSNFCSSSGGFEIH
jgi:hypothetical protein